LSFPGSRPGNDLTHRFPLIVEAVRGLRSRSCTIDGEAVTCGDDGLPSFDLLRHRRHDARVFLYAFDLIELEGEDRRRDPLHRRKADLTRVLASAGPGLQINNWLTAPTATAPPSSSTPASAASKASSRSARTRATGPAAATTGSRARIPTAQP
jgi:bifunctional non-homologous end joining protein LigD